MVRITPALDRITDKWTILILTILCPKPARFNDIKRRLNVITHKALADALKRLERNGLITRTVVPTRRIGVV
ncbi:winged helix-turn-helix transcriptional regulator [Aureimonas altamirensis]|uniref:winged helix-turn-helix transcriptional regulator n=1 Tax=Aureimonas altamirensis TaxID=370622 RepID=UPI003B971D38